LEDTSFSPDAQGRQLSFFQRAPPHVFLRGSDRKFWFFLGFGRHPQGPKGPRVATLQAIGPIALAMGLPPVVGTLRIADANVAMPSAPMAAAWQNDGYMCIKRYVETQDLASLPIMTNESEQYISTVFSQ